MASPVKMYQQEMHDRFGFYATWLPGDRMEIGDAGVFVGGQFRRMASVADLGLECKVSTGTATQNVQFTSSKGTKIGTAAGAAAAAIGAAEISVEFAHEGAFVFHASGVQSKHLENRLAVGREIVKAWQRGEWQKEWMLVEALQTAKRATIIVSEESSAGVVLAANAKGPLASISFADPEVAVRVASTRGRVVSVIAKDGLHPLYLCLRLHVPLLGAPALRPVRGGKAPADEDVSFSRPGIDELLDS